MKLTEVQMAHVRTLAASGRLTPEEVVADAMDKSSPLHPLFVWNKAEAARRHWLNTARRIIASVYVVTTTTTGIIRPPYFVRDPALSGREQGYRVVEALRSDPEAARQSLINTLAVARGHLRRALDLSVALGMTDEIDKLIEEVVGLERRLENAA